jgi:hypothetical protein
MRSFCRGGWTTVGAEAGPNYIGIAIAASCLRTHVAPHHAQELAQESLRYYLKHLAVVNSLLQDRRTACSDVNLLNVVGLVLFNSSRFAGSAWCWELDQPSGCDVDEGEAHIKGLEKIVQVKGGIEAVTLQSLRCAIFR